MFELREESWTWFDEKKTDAENWEDRPALYMLNDPPTLSLYIDVYKPVIHDWGGLAAVFLFDLLVSPFFAISKREGRLSRAQVSGMIHFWKLEKKKDSLFFMNRLLSIHFHSLYPLYTDIILCRNSAGRWKEETNFSVGHIICIHWNLTMRPVSIFVVFRTARPYTPIFWDWY